MGSITQKDLRTLFTRVDEKLKRPIDIYVIGGAAAILGYNVVKMTEDVDLDGPLDPDLDKIFSEEARKLGLDLYLASKGIFSPPEGYRDRMISEIFPKKRLRVHSLTQYDLAISKIDRGAQKDMDDIVAVHRRSPFELATLIRLFNDEYIRVAAIGEPREKMMSLLDVIEKLFGADAKKASMAKIGFTPRV